MQHVFSKGLWCLFHRYCVLLITGEEESFVTGNEAFLSLASANTNDVLRFAYVYERRQQPLCDALLKNKDSTPPQVDLIFSTQFGLGWPICCLYRLINVNCCFLPQFLPTEIGTINLIKLIIMLQLFRRLLKFHLFPFRLVWFILYVLWQILFVMWKYCYLKCFIWTGLSHH